MENKLKVWIARDEDGRLYVHFNHPLKGQSVWWLPDSETYGGDGGIRIESDLFPSVKWEDEEPTEAYITLAEPQPKQEQSKQDNAIDWEQRRYEIAKDMLPVLYQQSAEILKCGQSITWGDTAGCALVLADALIAKLKEQSK